MNLGTLPTRFIKLLAIVSFLIVIFSPVRYLQADDTYRGKHSKIYPRTNGKAYQNFLQVIWLLLHFQDHRNMGL